MRGNSVIVSGVAAFVLLAAMVVGSGPAASQAADRVGLNGDPCSYGSVADALADASPGDTVAVSTGTYNETLGLIDFDVLIMAADASCTPTLFDDPGAVVIDGGGSGFTNGGHLEVLSAEVTLRDITLRDTNAEVDGGVVYVDGGTFELEFGAIEAGSADADGGAIAAVGDSSVSLRNSRLLENRAGGDGGAISMDSGFLIIEDSLIEGPLTGLEGNVPGAANNGGLIAARNGAQVRVIESTLSEGTADLRGGAVWASDVSTEVTLLDTQVTNTFAVEGAGLAVVNGAYVDVVQSRLTVSIARLVGAVFLDDASVRLIDSMVRSNAAGRVGGIEANGSSRVELLSTTVIESFVGTVYQEPGGPTTPLGPSALSLNDLSVLDAQNSIVWGNDGPDPIAVVPSVATWRHSDIEGSGGSGPGWDSSVWGQDLGGNIDVAPQLDAQGVPEFGSPVRDAGLASLLPPDEWDLDGDEDRIEGLSEDWLGRKRVRGAELDMGAVERPDRQFMLRERPCSVLSTAEASGALEGPLAGGDVISFDVTGPLDGQGFNPFPCLFGDPDVALLHVAVEDPLRAANFRISEAGIAPTGGVLNFSGVLGPTFQTLPNANVVPTELDDAGYVDLAVNAGPFGVGLDAGNSRIEVVGAFYDDMPDGSIGLDYHPLTPCAVLDTRPNQGAAGAFVGPFSGVHSLTVDVTGESPVGQGGGGSDCGVPSGAAGVIVNLVAINSTGAGWIGATEDADTTKFQAVAYAGLPANNSVALTVPISPSGTIEMSIDAFLGSTHARAVVLGYVDDAVGLQFNPVTPCAAFDSRSSQGATGTFAGPRGANEATTYQIAGTALPTSQGGSNGGDCGVPAGTEYVLVNLVAINPVGAGNLRADATGSLPSGGVLNFAPVVPNLNNSNAVPIPLDSLGRLDVFANGGPTPNGTPLTDVRGVVLGYFD